MPREFSDKPGVAEPQPGGIHSRPGAARTKVAWWRSRLPALLKIAITATILFYVARQVDFRAVVERASAASLPFLTLSIASLLLIPLLGGIRWWMVLRAMDRPDRLAPLVALFWIAMLFGQILPAAAGDGVRIWIASRRGAGLRTAIHSVLLERVSMVLMLLVVVVATEPLLSTRVGPSQALWIAPMLLSAGVAGLTVLIVADRLTARFQRWPLVRSLANLATDTRQVAFSAWMLPLSVLGVLTNLNFVVAGALLGVALYLPLSFLDYLAFFPLVMVAMVLPISFSGWGVREGVLVALLGTVGVPIQTAFAFSLMFGACVAVSSLPGLAIWWLDPDRKRPGSDRDPNAGPLVKA